MRFEREFTLKFEDEPISSAIATLSKMAGIPIELAGLSSDAPVSVNLRNATIQESIARILTGLDFIIIWHDDRSLTVLVLDQNSDAVTTSSASQDDLVPPSPDDPFASTVTLQDLREQDRNRVRPPPELDELVPPSEPGESVPTLADFEAMVKSQPRSAQNKEWSITDLVPPD